MPQPNQAEAVRRPRLIWPVLSGVALAALLAAAAFLMSYKVEQPPDNAKVIADDLRMTYASTPCVVFNTLDRELIANRAEISDSSKPLQLYSYASEKTFADVRADAKWKRDKACDYVTGFDQIVTRWMRLVGHRSRWTADGQWRW
ncbi:MAG TPA: hypothetical protein DEA80_14685 [Afipia sp.]|uniref:Uncharacterized protein n=1 Tax=Afipia broomeae ATCC 49717 TaxID=883078 RepID=K8P0H1_9BRAD|nr:MULTISPECIES: hypothetical protein [Afipia]MAH69429.1 hypothetical protein [Afipia sp.]OUX61420.1 MAG: hypothetical protein CBB64_09325 [Afipia sp. TMED4]EKS34224.1 hypothetical protein HMPREF9695_04134 [Afipia broomeae ATCC 49717]HAQ95209.1 hypothetical protein [Afipia sp.]HBF56743.1 hypothetical protein [Afipia sp.]